MKKVGLTLFQLCFLVAILFTATAAQATPIKVKRVTFDVTLSDSNTYELVGYLYYHGSYKHRLLQVALHGATFSHLYWDMPNINDHGYSYARYMADEGYAVLALDQLGTGESDNPDGDFLNVAESASALHQVLASLRSHCNPLDYEFDKIVAVGHSLGASTILYAEANYGAVVDGMVLAGYAVSPHPFPTVADLAPYFVNPYFYIDGPTRSTFDYYTPNADPDVMTYDETYLVDQVARQSVIDNFGYPIDPTPLNLDNITAPVFVQSGDQDVLYNGSYISTDPLYLPNAESVALSVLPDVGHAVNFHLTNQSSWDEIVTWIDATL